MMGFYDIRFFKITLGRWILKDEAQRLMIHECCIGIWKTKDLLYYYSQSHFMDFTKDTRWRLGLAIDRSIVGMELFQKIPLNSF